MNTLAKVLAVLLVVVFADAAGGFGLYRSFVHAGTGAFCAVARRSEFERHDCTARIFYSKTLWLLISAGMGVAGGYVTLNALKTRKW